MKYALLIMATLTLSASSNNALAFDRGANTIGETPRFSLHLTSPLALTTKGGLKLESIMSSGWAVLGCYTHYWGLYPGDQFAVEGRKYFVNEKDNCTNLFLYGKVLGGNADVNESYAPFWEQQQPKNIKIGGSYMGAGAGGGCRMNYGMFFFEFSFGLKAVGGDGPSSMDGLLDREIFYLSGPGAVVDLHLNLGFQLGG